MRCGVVVRKLGMSRIFDDSGNHVPVTILRLEDVEVLSAKSIEKDGYCAMQIGFGNKKPKNITRPLRGFFAKAKSEPKEKVVEFKVSEDAVLKIGDKIGVNHFVAGQKVDLTGISQGKGFAGSMKRHNFGGMQATHGVSISHRAHGSTGNSQDPGRTWRGKKMAGQYGNVRATIQNLTVVELIEEDNLILVKGAVPGSKNGILKMFDSIKHKVPENAPFPGGLKAVSKVVESNKEATANDDEITDADIQNDGDKVEN
ncbi:50S ribosomal protein L3 [Alphaproteobacteria bacterium]|nr:50S ribosomal protein L3 [Alphaproteobacteria bacterium]